MASSLERLRCLKRDVAVWMCTELDEDRWVRDHVEVARKELVIAVNMMEEEDDPDAGEVEGEEDE